jgi:carboxylesterase type B
MKARVDSLFAGLVFRACLGAFMIMLGASPLLAAMHEPVRTEGGLLSGVQGKDPATTVYKGIPYAAPPIGELRWKPPQPASPWQGVRKADKFGSMCPQRGPRTGSGDSVAISEDCLYLNVWSAAASAGEKRPVLVWFYGGGYTGGSGSSPGFDGEGLARKGLVVVTMNFRMGIIGFLATPELSRESSHNVSGNYSLLDNIASLQWVRRNIAAFGGDPDRVTIAGQSSGGESVFLLNGSPLAKGLFHRAVAESSARSPYDPALPGHPVYWSSVKDAESAGVKFTAAQDVHSMKELRAIPWDQFKLSGIPLDQYRPYFDGWLFPQGFNQTYARGLQNDVPFMTGFNSDELLGPPERMPVPTMAAFQSDARKKYGGMAEEFLKLYPANSDPEAVLAHTAAIRDAHRLSSFLLASDWKKAANNPVFTYYWTHAPPGPEHDTRGVYHGSEINYLFNNLYARDLPWTDEDRKIADLMSSYLVNFAATGDPNGKSLPAWPAFNPRSPITMELGDHFAPIPVADSARLDFMKRYFMTQLPQ